jgi:hypothetical protein
MVAALVPEVHQVDIADLFANRVAADVVMVVVEVAVQDKMGRPPDTIVAVVKPSTIVVAEHVPEVDPVDIADLFANRVAADAVMAVVEMAVEHKKEHQLAQSWWLWTRYNRDCCTCSRGRHCLRCVTTCFEVSALLANRVVADAIMAVVEVAVEHITGTPTDAI